MLAPFREWDPRLRGAVALALAVLLAATAVTFARKLSRDMTAFVRWQPQIVALIDGEDVYAAYDYPNPPLMGLLLYPFAALPTAVGAWLWFAVKLVLACFAVVWVLEAVAPRGPPLTAPWAIAAIVVSLRPILSDLQHGNVNILIAFLVMAGLRSLQKGRDAAAGIWVALAACLKLTPALLVVYFAYKRWWKSCAAFGAATVAFVLAPGLVLGFGHNLDLLASYHRITIAPFAVEARLDATLGANQALGAVANRYLTDAPSLQLHSGPAHFNVASLDVATVALAVRIVGAALLVGLAWVCRSPRDRRDLRIASEYALVLIATLVISPRTWKHHFVVMALPYACVLAWAARRAWAPWRPLLLGALVASQILVLSTSRDVARIVWFVPEAHEWAQAFGAFLLSALVVLIGLAAVLVAARRRERAAEPSPA